MTLLLKQIFAFIKLLNSDTGTVSLAAGMSLGMILGFAPVLSLQTLLVFLIIFLFRVQIGAAFLAAFFFKFVAFLLDPVFNKAGQAILETEGLKPLFTTMYNMPVVPLTRFNNSIVMGAGIVSVLLTPFAFILFSYLITKYRVTILARFQNTKFWKLVKATSLYQWYVKYDNLYG
ncbi:MAG: TIGR03546 family protein [Pseudobdellovibrionaceae bacterium]